MNIYDNHTYVRIKLYGKRSGCAESQGQDTAQYEIGTEMYSKCRRSTHTTRTITVQIQRCVETAKNG